MTYSQTRASAEYCVSTLKYMGVFTTQDKQTKNIHMSLNISIYYLYTSNVVLFVWFIELQFSANIVL